MNHRLTRDANQTGDNYVLLTVLFTSVLFFAGVRIALRELQICRRYRCTP